MTNQPLSPADWAKLERQGLVKRPPPFTPAMMEAALKEKARTSPHKDDHRSGDNWMTPGRRRMLGRNALARQGRAIHAEIGKLIAKPITAAEFLATRQFIKETAAAHLPPLPTTATEAIQHRKEIYDTASSVGDLAAPPCKILGCEQPAKSIGNGRGRKYGKLCAFHADEEARNARDRAARRTVLALPGAKPCPRTNKRMVDVLDLIDRRICAKVPMGQDGESFYKRMAFDEALTIVREQRERVKG